MSTVINIEYAIVLEAFVREIRDNEIFNKVVEDILRKK
jgi:hypothetical protein